MKIGTEKAAVDPNSMKSGIGRLLVLFGEGCVSRSRFGWESADIPSGSSQGIEPFLVEIMPR